MAEVLVASDLHKRYGETVALDGVSLSLDAGEVFGLVGPNGAGKTTLVRCLTGTTRPSAGSVSTFGSPIGDVDRSRIGLLPQSFAPHDRLTGRELVTYYAGLYDDPRAPMTVLEEVGMAGAADQRYVTLSGGQRRRVCVAIALVNSPDLLFLDEPTTGIDPAGRRAIWRLVSDLADAGTTVLLTTHYMEEAERLADRVGLMSAGRLVSVGPPADLVRTHGGESRLVVETDADPAALGDVPFTVTPDDSGLVFRDVAPTDVGEVIQAFEAREVPYTGFRWAEPDLEDVYLRLADGEHAGQKSRPESRGAQ